MPLAAVDGLGFDTRHLHHYQYRKDSEMIDNLNPPLQGRGGRPMSDNPREGWRIQHLFRDDPMDDWSDADYLDSTIVPFNPADRIKELEARAAAADRLAFDLVKRSSYAQTGTYRDDVNMIMYQIRAALAETT